MVFYLNFYFIKWIFKKPNYLYTLKRTSLEDSAISTLCGPYFYLKLTQTNFELLYTQCLLVR